MSRILNVTGAGVPFAPFAHIFNSDTALVTTVIFFAVLIYASVRDVKTREVGNYVHMIIAVTAFIGFEKENLPFMLLGAVVTALPLFIAGLLKKGGIGGADIKLMAASGLILGASRGITALILGMFLSVVCTVIIRKATKADLKASFPLIP